MSIEHNKQLLHRYIAEVWDNENVAALDQFLAPNYRRHRSPTTPPLTRDQQKDLLKEFREAFPDVTIMVEETICEEDRIAFRSTMRGTHQGTFLGLEPTHKWVIFSLLDVLRIENGKFIEQWGGPDIYDLVRQLGGVLSERSK